MDSRKQIRDLVAANAGALTGNLQNLWTRAVEDLVDGGVCLDSLAASLLDVSVTYKLAIEGKQRTVQSLRAIADLLEKNIPDAPLASTGNSGRKN